MKKVALIISTAGLVTSAAALPAKAGPMDDFKAKVTACMASMKDRGLSAKDAPGGYMSDLHDCMMK